MKSGGQMASSLSSGVLFAQAARPSAKGTHLSPCVFSSGQQFGRDEPVFSFGIPCNRLLNPTSFRLDAHSTFQLAFFIQQRVRMGLGRSSIELPDAQTTGGVGKFGALTYPALTICYTHGERAPQRRVDGLQEGRYTQIAGTIDRIRQGESTLPSSTLMIVGQLDEAHTSLTERS
jgi:hypothetical protein